MHIIDINIIIIILIYCKGGLVITGQIIKNKELNVKINSLKKLDFCGWKIAKL